MKLLITAEYSDSGIDFLKKYFSGITYEPWTKIGKGLSAVDLSEKLKKGEFSALITELDEVSTEVLSQNPNLKFIGDCRGNPVNVDVEKAKELDIPVFCTPARNAQAVAEHLLGLLICFYRNIFASAMYVKQEKWKQPAPHTYFKYQGNELHGKKVGLIGFGAIGKCVAQLLQAFGCSISFFDPFIEKSVDAFEKKSIESIFRESDIVSVHIPVTPDTKGLIDKGLLNKMKETALFVNTARAAVVDNTELFNMLKNNRIRGAVLDVFDSEPPNENDRSIIALDNVLATPHICGATFEVVEHQSHIINTQIENFLKTP